MFVTSEELRSLKPVVVAVVGPTNEGKTSLLRTLTSDPNFGLVNAYNGTTVRAEIQKVFYKGVAEILQLVDTPGFQTSNEIVELLLDDPEVESRGGAFGLEDILRVIPQDDDDFRHDLRAWREVERCDVAIFVVNVVENPNQSLLKNTLRLLKNIGKPTVVAYNNVRDDAISADFRDDWDETLRKNGFYLIQKYDAHHRSFANEVELFEKITALARDPLTQRVLKLEIRERRARELRRLQRSREIVAELLLDVAAYREVEANVGRDEWKNRLEILEEKLKQNVASREHDAHLELLETWGFRVGVLNREMLVVDDVAEESDRLFGVEAKRHLRLGGGVGASIGAAVGAALDLATAGMSLGMGIAVGGLVGGLLGGGGAMVYNSKYDAKNKILTVQPLQCVREALLAREVDLVRKLQTRGKALEDSTQAQIASCPKHTEVFGLGRALDEFAEIREFSRMNEQSRVGDWRRLPGAFALTKERKTREEAIATIIDFLKKAIPDVE